MNEEHYTCGCYFCNFMDSQSSPSTPFMGCPNQEFPSLFNFTVTMCKLLVLKGDMYDIYYGYSYDTNP